MGNDLSSNSFRTALVLGYAGLLPQTASLAFLLLGTEGSIALVGGFAYAALIFSFLGGVWWGQALSIAGSPRWIYFAAVMPSLIAFGLFVTGAVGWVSAQQQLIVLGALVAGSPLVDHAIHCDGVLWMRLRWHLSIGLGLLTMMLGLLG